MIKVVKFGGSSLASAEQFAKVGKIIQADKERRYVVPSAPGKRNAKDTKVTDMLYACYALVEAEEDFRVPLMKIKDRYDTIINGLNLKLSLEEEFKKISENFKNKAGVDYAASRGEYLNGIIMANYLGYEFVDAAEVISFEEDGTFDAEKTNKVLADGVTAADLTVSEPALIGWLHTLEAISQLCMASARYRAAANYARRVLKAEGYPTRAAGTVLLALARLEDEDGFFALAHQLEEEIGADALENSPWYLLARTILLFKTNKMRPATRALREFANRCEGGAFFLLNSMYQTPYLPCRPEPRDPWDLSHQAVWEADGIISDTPDFAPWANACEDVSQLAQEFARRYGF